MKDVYRINETGIIIEIKYMKDSYELLDNEFEGVPEYKIGQHHITGVSPNGIVTFDDLKANKISELSSICESNCLNGIDFSWNEGTEELPDIQTRHYSLSALDQMKINTLYFNCKNGQAQTTWHYDGGACEVWDSEKFIAFAESSIMFVTSNTVRFNTGLRPYIESLTEDNSSIEEIESIGWDYILPEDIEYNIQNMISVTLTGSEISV